MAKVILPTIADGGLLQSVNPEDCLDMDIYADKFKLLAITDESWSNNICHYFLLFSIFPVTKCSNHQSSMRTYIFLFICNFLFFSGDYLCAYIAFQSNKDDDVVSQITL